MALTAGSACVTRSGNLSSTYASMIEANNPANETDTADTVYVYSFTTMTNGVEFASFNMNGAVGANRNATTDGDTNGSNLTVTSGACRTFTASGGDFTAFQMTSGGNNGFIGIHFVDGTIYRDTASGVGYWTQSATTDCIPCTGVLFVWTGTRTLSLLATHEAVAAATIPRRGHSFGFVLGKLLKSISPLWFLGACVRNAQLTDREKLIPWKWLG